MGLKRKRKRLCRRRADNRIFAKCPFRVKELTDPAIDQHGTKPIQKSPFNPSGTSITRQTMSVSYSIMPHKKWNSMAKHRGFRLNDVEYNPDDFVYIADENAIKRQQAAASERPELSDCWIATILEIRAEDKDHVYALICWMYAWKDLPKPAQSALKYVRFDNPNELIASNHMDVINVISVVDKATVHQRSARTGYKAADERYWRFVLDYLTSKVFYAKGLKSSVT